jgi:hypothetical protein
MLKRIHKTTPNAKKTPHIILLVILSDELMQPELLIMYCSRYLEGYWVVQEVNHEWRTLNVQLLERQIALY